MGTTNFKPIAMRCNEEQFEAIKPKLEKIGIIGKLVLAFERYSYLTNNYEGETNCFDFIGAGEDWEYRYENNIHEEWNEKIFLEACGVVSESGWYVEPSEHNAFWLAYRDFERKLYYGFDARGEWFYKENYENEVIPTEIKADMVNVVIRLLEEAKQRGFNIVKSNFSVKDNVFWYRGEQLMKDGVWKEVKKYVQKVDSLPKHVQYYFYKDNFYKILREIRTKTENGWEDFVIYQQTGSDLEFSRNKEQFLNKFKKIMM